MANFRDYYMYQAGNGMPVFSGVRYQRGHGFFGDAWDYLYGNILKPTGDYIIPKVINTGKRIGSDIMDGKNILDSLKKNLGDTAEEILDDGVARVKKFIQTGKGRKRKHRKSKKAIKATSRRRKLSLKRKPTKRKVVRKRRKSLKSTSQKNKFLELLK